MRIACLWIPAWSTDAASDSGSKSSIAAASQSAARERSASGSACPSAAASRSPQMDPESDPAMRLSSRAWLTLEASLLEETPRVVVDPRGRIWADVAGLDESRAVSGLRRRLVDGGWADVGVGVADVPVAAELAAKLSARAGQGDGSRAGQDGVSRPARRSASGAERKGAGSRAGVAPLFVPSGRERAWLSRLPLELLEPDASLLMLLRGVGVDRCGALGELDREAVEVRFGPDGVALWRLARAQDDRILFGRPAPDRPQASLDFVDYVVTDPERLLFTANSLLGSICGTMERRGLHARRLLLRLDLGNGECWQRSLKSARPTASRTRWRALIRSRLERLTVPDAVTGVHLEVQSTEEATAQQGDLFDRGFATAPAVEAALMRLVDEQGPVVVMAGTGAHPLAERRVEWHAADDVAFRPEGGIGSVAGTDGGRAPDALAPGAEGPGAEGLGAEIVLQLLPEPLRVEVETEPRRDHAAPVRLMVPRGRLRSGRTRIESGAPAADALPVESNVWLELLGAAGPQRLSGGQWEGGYAREYFRCITSEGVPLQVYRDPFSAAWFLHGWWD